MDLIIVLFDLGDIHVYFLLLKIFRVHSQNSLESKTYVMFIAGGNLYTAMSSSKYGFWG